MLSALEQGLPHEIGLVNVKICCYMVILDHFTSTFHDCSLKRNMKMIVMGACKFKKVTRCSNGLVLETLT